MVGMISLCYYAFVKFTPNYCTEKLLKMHA